MTDAQAQSILKDLVCLAQAARVVEDFIDSGDARRAVRNLEPLELYARLVAAKVRAAADGRDFL